MKKKLTLFSMFSHNINPTSFVNNANNSNIKSTLPTTRNSVLFSKQDIVNEHSLGFSQHFKRAFTSIMLTMISFLFVGGAFAATTTLSATGVTGLSNGSPLVPGAIGQAIFGFSVTGSAAGTITAVTFTTSGNTSTSISNVRLYNNGTTAAYTGSGGSFCTVGSTTQGATTIALTSISANNSFSTTATYFYVICDVASSPTLPFTISISSTANLTSSIGGVTGTVTNSPFNFVTFTNFSQTLGLFPATQGGFENQYAQTTVTQATTSGLTWANRAGGTQNTISTSGTPRTGSFYGTFPIQTTNGKYFISPAISPAVSTTYVVQFYYRTTAAPAATIGVGLGTTFGTSAASSVLSLVNTSSVWTKAPLATVGTGATASDGTGFAAIKTITAGLNSLAAVDVDDIVIYPNCASCTPVGFDNVAPANVTGQSATAGNASNVLNWSASSDAESGLAGYLIVRLATTALTGSPNANGIYAVGNTLGNGTVVALIPAGTTTFTDNGLTNTTQYNYAIYAVDNAFNYSAAANCSGTPFLPNTYYWNGASNSATPAAGGTGTWGTANNWRFGTNTGTASTWADASAAVIAGTAGTVTVNANFTPTSTTFSTTGYTLTTGASAVTLAGTVALGTSAITLAPASAQSLTLSGAISGSGLITINGSGGTAVLSSVNTNTGGVTLTAGTLAINNASALGTAGTFTINGGSIDNTSGSSVTTSNYPLSLGSNLTFTGSNALNLGTGAVALTTSRTITATASTLTLGGVISGAFNLTKAGAGTLVLTGTNTLTGTGTGSTINVTGGTLQLNGTTTIPTGTSCAVGSGATLRISTDQSIGNLDLTGGGTIVVDASKKLTITGTYTPSTGTITNNGTIILNSSGINFPGTSATTTTFNSLQISANATLNNNLTLGTTGVLTLTSGILTTTGYTLTISNTSNAAIVGGSTTTYISGPVSWNLAASLTSGNANSKYTFPVGTTGTTYLPLLAQFGTNGSAGNTATVQVFSAGSYSTTNDGSITPSSSEYWNLTTTQTGGATFLTSGSGAIVVTLGKSSLGSNNVVGANTGTAGAYVSYGGSTGQTVSSTTAVGPSNAIGGGSAGNYNLVLGVLSGVSYYWNGGNASPQSANWNTGLWYTSAVATTGGLAWPSAGASIASFSNSQGGTVTLPTTYNSAPQAVAIAANGYTFNTAPSTPSTLSCNIDLGANTLTISPDATAANITLSGFITGTGVLAQNGGGTTIVSNNNTFTGGVSIGAGALQMGNAGAINSTTPNAVTFTSGSTGKLQLNGNNLTVPSLNTNAIPGSPVIENASASAKTLTINSAGTSTYAGVIQDGTGGGALSVTNSGAGTVTLSGNNSYTGTTTNSAGSLILSGNNTGTGTLSVTGGSVTLAGTNAFTGSPAVTVSALAQLNINNAAALPNATTINMNSTSIFDNTSGSDIALTNNINLGNLGAALTFTGSKSLNLGTGTYSITSGHTLTVSSNTLTFGGVIGETLSGKGVTKSGLGTLVLSGANTYTGATAVSQGTLVVGANVPSTAVAGPLGTAIGSVIVGNASTVSGSNPTLLIGGAYTFARLITIASSAPTGTGYTYTIGGSTDNNAIFSGNISLSATGCIISQVANTGSNALTISGVIISGSHGITKTGAGNVILTAGNTYTTSTNVSAGKLQLNHPGGTTVPATSATTVSTGATLQISSNQTLASLALSGTGSLIIDNGVTLTVTGAFSIGTGTITGGGSLILQGGATGFPGSTSSTFTNLSISGTGITLSSNVSVTGLLTLTSVNLTLGANNLTLAYANAISGAGKIVTNSTGDVIVAFPTGAGSAYTFPLSPNGTSTESVTLTKTGTGTQTYTVSVGYIAFAQSNALSYSWSISTNLGASSVATNIALSWATADANGTLNSFPGNGGILQYISGAWTYSSGGTITGTPNVTTLTGVTDFSNSSFTVGTPPLQAEPSNYPTGFTASATASNQGQVTLTWVDATGAQLPSGYLIAGSSVGFSSITTPTDGNAVTTSGLNYNVGYTVQTATITGLTENSTYYFKIYPYSNSGTDINYLTSGSVPQVSGQTANITNVVTDVFRSKISGNWATASTWESYDGTTWITASAPPDATSTGGITILSGHTVTVAASVGATNVTIASGGQVTVAASQTLTINHTTGATADITVAGTLQNQGTVTEATGALMTVTGTYEHKQSAGVIPTATWSNGSTLLLTTTGTTVGGFTQSFYNVTFNSLTNTGSFSLGMFNTVIRGDLQILSFGTTAGTGIGLTTTGTGTGSNTITINGNLILNTNNSTNYFTSYRSGNPASTTTSVTINILGNLTITQGILDLQNGTGGGAGVTPVTWNLGGNFTFTAGGFRSNSPSSSLHFANNATHTYTNAGGTYTAANATIVVDNGSILQLGSQLINGTVLFATSAGSTLESSIAGGINGNLTTTGTKTLDPATNYLFDGSGTMATGALATGANNLTITNTTGTTTVSATLAVTGKLSITSGTLACGAGLLTLKSTSIANTAVVGQVGGTITGTAIVERYIPAGFRSYRDMAPEVYNATSTTGSMYKNWQENGSMTSGTGIFITGTTATHANTGGFYTSQPAPDANGLDYSINGLASAYSYINGSGYNAGFNVITNTTTTNLDAFSGYRVLVRGDRSFNLATTPIINYYNIGLRMANATKLRTTGNLVYGTVTYSTSGVSATVNGGSSTMLSANGLTSSTTNGFSMVANPYVCPVYWGSSSNDQASSVFGNSGNINGSYWYIDPTQGGTDRKSVV